jgi:hypothetical protein
MIGEFTEVSIWRARSEETHPPKTVEVRQSAAMRKNSTTVPAAFRVMVESIDYGARIAPISIDRTFSGRK